jgi:hypothetical protein
VLLLCRNVADREGASLPNATGTQRASKRPRSNLHSTYAIVRIPDLRYDRMVELNNNLADWSKFVGRPKFFASAS